MQRTWISNLKVYVCIGRSNTVVVASRQPIDLPLCLEKLDDDRGDFVIIVAKPTHDLRGLAPLHIASERLQHYHTFRIGVAVKRDLSTGFNSSIGYLLSPVVREIQRCDIVAFGTLAGPLQNLPENK
ncbi:unnamed protein product [Phytophthora fragariaefolia]|uniref:Unnamed protein product n=1 Tax=Phytophthora fragariaefolia TaxID=1490495 RepID=A0A9W7CV13_9STRA|nr:unnamed protein product [Phytophthora fragariaefolia]